MRGAILKINSVKLLVGFSAISMSNICFGQSAVPPSITPAPAVEAAKIAPESGAMIVGQVTNGQKVLPAGTSIRFRTLSALSSQDNKVGQQFDLEVVQDVLLDGVVVIPRGSAALGEVSLVKKKGMWGKSGKLETRLLSVHCNGRDIPIHGTVGEKGDTGTAGVVASIVVLPVAGFFVTGTSAVMPAGSPATGQINSDLPIVFAQPAVAVPAVMTVTPAAN